MQIRMGVHLIIATAMFKGIVCGRVIAFRKEIKQSSSSSSGGSTSIFENKSNQTYQ